MRKPGNKQAFYRKSVRCNREGNLTMIRKDKLLLAVLTAAAFGFVSAGSVQACSSRHNTITNFNQPVKAQSYALTIRVKQSRKRKKQ